MNAFFPITKKLQSSAGTLPRLLALAVVLAWWVTGCAVGPDYKRPPLDVPADFRGENQSATNSLADLAWWEIFHDADLQKLIRVALTNNYDVRIAVTRIEQARQVVIEARAGLFPQIGYAGEAGRGKNVGSGGTLSPGTGSGTVFGADVNASWEIDLWGQIRRMTESARAQFLATEQTQRDVTISLIAQIAQNYFQLLALDRELEIAKETTNSFGESLRIFTQRLQGGVSSKLETSAAAALLASVAATIPDLERQIQLQENQISVLLGNNPASLLLTNSVLENQTIPLVPAGLPSTLLERRPDVRQAEQLLQSANAQVGVAKANFFPQLSLTAIFGRVSPELSGLTGGGANAWALAAGLTGPIFQGGRIRAQFRQALAARDQFALQYKSTVLNAFQEVSSSLISRDKLAEVRQRQVTAVEAYKEAVKIASERYRLGQSSYYEVLQEQQLLFPAENTLVQTELNQLVAIVQLYRALGGGWNHPSKTSNKVPESH